MTKSDKVCLLITIFNRGHLLKHSLERLTKLTLPDEILVVDDGGSDNTKEVVDSFKDRLPIRYIYNHAPYLSICSFSRNIGIKNTDCEIIITSEPELLFVTDVIKQMLEQAQTNDKTIISAGTIYHQGTNKNISPELIENPFLWLQKNKRLINESKHNTIAENPNGFAKVIGWQATFAALYRKEWIFAVQGWDEEFPAPYAFDDVDLCTRLRIKLGIGQIINNNIETIHQYHGHPLGSMMNATMENSKYMEDKKMSVNGFEDPNNPRLIANVGKEWGVIIPRP